MSTVPNQKVVVIQKNSYKSDFLQIGISEWQEASKVLSPAAFKLYLYLASNASGFRLALSQVAVENAIGISKSTYHRAVKELEEKRYLQLDCGNTYFFQCSSPKNETITEKESSPKIETNSPKNETTQSQKWDQVSSKMNREIDNIDNTDKINKEKEEKEKEIKEKCNMLLKRFDEDSRNGVFDDYETGLLLALAKYIKENKETAPAAVIYEEISATRDLVYAR